MRQLYIAVALPKMTYALDVWYTPPTKPVGQRKSIGSVGVLRQMTKLQRLAPLDATLIHETSALDATFMYQYPDLPE
jgi:hypothetical protein